MMAIIAALYAAPRNARVLVCESIAVPFEMHPGPHACWMIHNKRYTRLTLLTRGALRHAQMKEAAGRCNWFNYHLRHHTDGTCLPTGNIHRAAPISYGALQRERIR